jgi:DNA-binding MarR family transcriptional regulator
MTPVGEWDEIGRLVEGLAYAQRPIFAAVRGITKELGLGPRGAFILNLVSDGVEFPNELATKIRASRSLITADLNRLIHAGLIDSTTDADDKRMTRLKLTDAGLKICSGIRDEMARIVTRNLSGYSAAELRLFSEMLQSVRRLEPEEEGC